MGLEVGLHTCIRHTFAAPISSKYSNHKMCPLHTFHLCIQRYKGHNVSCDIGVGSRGGKGTRGMCPPLKIDLFGKPFQCIVLKT